MALTTFRLTFLPRLRDERYVRRYRNYLLDSNKLAPSRFLLQHLNHLHFCVEQPKIGRMSLLNALTLSSQIQLQVSDPTQGLLALKQICLQWARGVEINHSYFPLLVMLPEIAPHETPTTLLQRESTRLRLAADDLSIKRGLAAGIWLFLFVGWDELTPKQQAQWTTWIEAWRIKFPALSFIIPSTQTQAIIPSIDIWHLQSIA